MKIKAMKYLMLSYVIVFDNRLTKENGYYELYFIKMTLKAFMRLHLIMLKFHEISFYGVNYQI